MSISKRSAMADISDIRACFKFVSGVLNGAFDEGAINPYMPALKRLIPEKNDIRFLDACDALASAIDGGNIPAEGIKVLKGFSANLKSHKGLRNSRLQVSLGIPAETLQPADHAKSQASAQQIFKLISGVMNGAFTLEDVKDFQDAVRAWCPKPGKLTFADANLALQNSIEAGSVPEQGLSVLKSLAKHHGSVLSDGLVAILLDAADTDLDSQDSNSLRTTVESEGNDQSLDEEVQPKLDEKQPSKGAEGLKTSGDETPQDNGPQPEQQSKANKLFQEVVRVLMGNAGGVTAESFNAQCAELAACVRAGEVPKKGRAILRDNQTGKGNDFSIAGDLEDALQAYACQLCRDVEPDHEKCATCRGFAKIACNPCQGTGRFRPLCRACNGTGRGYTKPACPVCKGAGTKDVGECRACNGTKTSQCIDCLDGRALCKSCILLQRDGAECKRREAAASRQAFNRQNGPPPKGVSIERCNRAELTRLQNLWLERQSQQMPGGGRACGEVLEAWKVDNPLLAFDYKSRRDELKSELGREADKLEGFHGTHPDNIISICANGFDAGRRAGQVYGAGEYFAKNPHVSIGYSKGGQYMLVCRLTLGYQSSTPQNLDGDHIWVPENGYYVIKEPNQVLVQYIVKFQTAQRYNSYFAICDTLERHLSDGYSTKPPPQKKNLPAPRPCQMTRPSAMALWMGLLPAHIPDDTIKNDVLSFLSKHAPHNSRGAKIQILCTHFKKAHIFLQTPMPRDVVKRLNQETLRTGGEAIKVCVDDFHGSPEQRCPKWIAGYCRGQNLRFTQPCWCRHEARATENAKFTLKSIPLDGAKGDEIISKFMASAPFHNGMPRVVGIKQIRNDNLAKCHETYRQWLTDKHGEEPAVQELYHGTNNNITDLLYTHGLQPPSDMEPADDCPVSGGKGLCTSLCNNTCKYCTQKHEWRRCHMYGLGIYLADLAQKSHRYISQPKTSGGRQTYRMIICSVLGKSYEIEGYLKGDRVMHDVYDVRGLTEEDVDDMIETCQPCRAPKDGVGALIVGANGERWGRVVAEECACWRLHTGRVAKKETEGSRWDWSQQGEISVDAIETAAEKSDLLYIKGLGDRTRPGYSVINSEYIAFHPHQCLPMYEIEYELR